MKFFQKMLLLGSHKKSGNNDDPMPLVPLMHGKASRPIMLKDINSEVEKILDKNYKDAFAEFEELKEKTQHLGYMHTVQT